MEKFTKVRNIGKGNMGACALARNNEDGRYYVIKQVDLAKLNKKERQQSLNEAKVLSALRHPNVINYYDSFLARKSDHLCIVMEYADGGDLSQRIKNNHGVHFSQTQVLDWFIQSVLSLHYTHQRKILHRDVKTQNIFLTQDNLCKLGDYGIARTLNSTYDQASTFVGTPYYLSPELILERPYDHMSDVWALGVVLYEMMALKHPFNANDMKSLMHRILKVQYEPPPTIYSPELRYIVSKILVKDPTQRIRLSEVLELNIISSRIQEWMNGGILPAKYITALIRSKSLPPSLMAYAMQQSAVIAANGGGGGGSQASSPSHASQQPLPQLVQPIQQYQPPQQQQAPPPQTFKNHYDPPPALPKSTSPGVENHNYLPPPSKAISPPPFFFQAPPPQTFKNHYDLPPALPKSTSPGVENHNYLPPPSKAISPPPQGSQQVGVGPSRPQYNNNNNAGGGYEYFTSAAAGAGGGGGYPQPPAVNRSPERPLQQQQYPQSGANNQPRGGGYDYAAYGGGGQQPQQQQAYRRESEDVLLRGGGGAGRGSNAPPPQLGGAARASQLPPPPVSNDYFSRNALAPQQQASNSNNIGGGKGAYNLPPAPGRSQLPALGGNNNINQQQQPVGVYRAYQAQQEYDTKGNVMMGPPPPRSLAPVVVHGQGGIAPPPLRPSNMGMAYGGGGGVGVGGGVAAAMHGYRGGGGGGGGGGGNAIQQHNNDIQAMLQRAAQERAQRQKMFR
ncbi:protein kinase, putative [Bodo saltans]|uniref:non-specific serine/threonine protein kinase n=1 Tax=Bodo saltans TaxID=75058 RepID=A0A0S4IRB1_BODSA|nr:protein kinase, putative [Bodo saltans]|eukprot:CUF43152.1 protein kinase, putative [Bodo saltans]